MIIIQLKHKLLKICDKKGLIYDENKIEKNNNEIKFANKLSPNDLIKKLSKYDIEKLLIEEATLEEMFLHYYK